MTEQIGVHTPKPRFDGTINLGHVLGAVTLAITIGGFGVASMKASSDQAAAFNALTTQVVALKADVSAIGPRLTASEKINDLNAERITNAANSARSLREELANNTAELRRADNALQVEINGVKVSLAGIGPRTTYGDMNGQERR